MTLPITAAVTRDTQAGRELGYVAGPGFFEAWTFPFVRGNPETALRDPYSIVISESLAEKYFGPEWARDGVVGRSIRLSYWQSAGGVLGEALTVETEDQTEFTINGVFRDVPPDSTLRFDLVLPASVVLRRFGHVQSWGPRWFELSLLLRPGTDTSALAKKIGPVLLNGAGVEDQTLVLQPFRQAYLRGAYQDGVPSGGRIQQVYLIGLVGLAILLMACINFANLVTARAGGRAREIGVRKAMGATPSYLIQQFLSEAVLTTFVAFVLAVGLALFALPLFNSVTGTSIQITDLSVGTWTFLAGIALVTGCFAGSYPAFYLASLQPVRVLRGHAITRRRGEVGMRKGLVIFQFAISAILIVGTLTVYQQLQYLQNKDLGLDKDNVVMIRLEGGMIGQYDAVRAAILQTPAIQVASRSSEDPISVAIKNANVLWQGKREDQSLLFTVLRTDARFAETMKLRLSSGRFFDETRDAGQLRFVVNESAVRAMGLESPIGHPLAFGFDLDDSSQGLGEIVGVVEDFHTGSLTDEVIAPLVFRYEPEETRYLVARVAPGGTAAALASLERIQSSLNPGYPFEYTFLDDTYLAYYEDHRVLATLSNLFAFVALLIACLGLLGLSAYSVQQRTKEIGVRRVLGATKAQLLVVLSREFMTLVGVALVLSIPVSVWGMQQWLASFAYRVDIGVGTVLLAAGISVLIATLTVGYQALRALRMGPVRALRSE